MFVRVLATLGALAALVGGWLWMSGHAGAVLVFAGLGALALAGIVYFADTWDTPA